MKGGRGREGEREGRREGGRDLNGGRILREADESHGRPTTTSPLYPLAVAMTITITTYTSRRRRNIIGSSTLKKKKAGIIQEMKITKCGTLGALRV